MSDAHQRLVRAQFGPSAGEYVTSAAHAGGDDLALLIAWGRALRPRRVLDVATGGGHTALAFAAVAPRVTACDLTEAMLQAARGLVRQRGAANVAFTVGDVEALPFRDATFDVVTCRIAAHHFPDVAAALRQVHRVLRPGGSLLLQDILGHDDGEANAFILEVEQRRDPSHVRAYRGSEWKAFLRAAGLTMIDDARMAKRRRWAEWTARMRMTPESRAALEGFVRGAPERLQRLFDFTFQDDAIEFFTDRMILIRADKD